MKEKIAEIIYNWRYGKHNIDAEQIADKILALIRESLPAEYDDILDLNPQYANGYSAYRQALLKVLGE